MAQTPEQKKNEQRKRRHAKIRSCVVGTSEKPRLSVHASNRFVQAQFIDDGSGMTLVAGSTRTTTIAAKTVPTKTEAARELGLRLGALAQEKNIARVVFDRGGFLYTGRVKACAEGVRESGISF
jgi:large subunit ribosomal protein L18